MCTDIYNNKTDLPKESNTGLKCKEMVVVQDRLERISLKKTVICTDSLSVTY